MTEQVTITPLGGRDSNGDPLPDGASFSVRAYEVAPGNTLLEYGIGGDLDSVEFTAYLPLRVRDGGGSWSSLADKLAAPFSIDVRDRRCVGRMQEWNSGGRGGIAVLCHSATGQSVR